MTDNQKNIIGTILLNMSASTLPVTEEMISNLVDMNDNMNAMMYGTPQMTPEERQEVINALHAALFVRIDRGHYVKENNHTPWYMAAKAENSSKFWDRYRLYLLKEKHWNGDTINELDKTTDEIMDLLGNPVQADEFMRRGLCIGDVQSGKTSTYIGLINKAADAHYRVIILLTGTIEKLRRQTQQRIDEGFIGLDSYAFTLEKGRVQVGVGAIDPTTSGWAVTSTSSDFNAATAKKVVGQLSGISAPVIFVLKKNKSVLEKLEHWLRFYNKDSRDGKSLADLISMNFKGFDFRGTCLTLDEFDEEHGFNFAEQPQDFDIDYLVSFCEYTNNAVPQKCIVRSTGLKRNTDIFNYQVSHIWGHTKNVFLFESPWNICYAPKIMDPFTGHETKGTWPQEYQQLFLSKALDLYRPFIDDYNNLIMNLDVAAKIGRYVQEKRGIIPDKDLLQFEKDAINEFQLL